MWSNCLLSRPVYIQRSVLLSVFISEICFCTRQWLSKLTTGWSAENKGRKSAQPLLGHLPLQDTGNIVKGTSQRVGRAPAKGVLEWQGHCIREPRATMVTHRSPAQDWTPQPFFMVGEGSHDSLRNYWYLMLTRECGVTFFSGVAYTPWHNLSPMLIQATLTKFTKSLSHTHSH